MEQRYTINVNKFVKKYSGIFILFRRKPKQRNRKFKDEVLFIEPQIKDSQANRIDKKGKKIKKKKLQVT